MYDNNQSPFLTASQVARLIGVSRYTVYAWERDGSIPKSRTFRGWKRWKRTDIERWLQRNGVAS